MNRTSEDPWSLHSEIATALVYATLEACSPHTGINRISDKDALFNILHYEWFTESDLNKGFSLLLKQVSQVKKIKTIEALTYDDTNPYLEGSILYVPAVNATETELNAVLAAFKSSIPNIKFKRKSRNLRAVYPDFPMGSLNN